MSIEILLTTALSGGVALFGYLLNRSISAIDTSLKDTCLTMSKLELQMNGYGLLAEYLKERVEELEAKNDTLTRSFNEMDKLIAVKLAGQGLPPAAPRKPRTPKA